MWIIERRFFMNTRTYTIAAIAVWFIGVSPVWASEKADARDAVTQALETVRNFKTDPEMEWFRDHVEDAQALFIVPQRIKGGLIFGGSGGRGVLVKRDDDEWVGPAFYTMGSGSVGLQIGVEVSEVILLVMTQKGVDAFLSTKAQLGADASVAAGPVGAGAQTATADVQGFARSKGAFAGVSFEGAVISPDDSRNEAYYGEEVTLSDILVRRKVHNDHASRLLEAVSEIQ
jgi:lipid-binding SYLF domain-containing protein